MFSFDPDEVFENNTTVLAERNQADEQLERLSVETRVALAYGDADLGTRVCIYGGEVYEF
jgi:hypothetical protein